MKDSRVRRFLGLCAAAALLGAIAALIQQRSTTAIAASLWEVPAPHRVANTTRATAAAPASVYAATPPAPRATAQSVQAIPSESDYAQARSQRWEPATPGLSDLGEPIPLQKDPSCAGSAFLKNADSLQSTLAQHLGVRTASDRERLFFSKDRRFFTRDGRFHQITAVWDSFQPPRYRIEWFSAADAGLSTDVRAEALPAGLPVYADALEAREIIGAIAPAGDAADERLGSRYLSAEIPASPSTPAVEVGFVNGKPFAVGFDGGSCRLLASGDAAFCNCSQTSNGVTTHAH